MTKQGQKLPSEISASTIDVAGRSHIIAMVRDITERRQAEKAERDLALVKERNRLAREIHDSLAQGLTGIIWKLNAAEQLVEVGGKEALQSLESVRQLARESLQEARRSVWDLRSSPLQNLSLAEALRQEAGKIADVGIESSFEVTGKERVLPAGVETVSNQQKWDTLGAERSGAGWRSGELPEGPVVASSPFGGLSLHFLPAL